MLVFLLLSLNGCLTLDETLDPDEDGVLWPYDCDNSNDRVLSGTPAIYYRDADTDGYGDQEDSYLGCTQNSGYIIRGGDCNDQDETIHPLAQEVCDNQDNDCDKIVDIDDDSLDTTTASLVFADADGDGFGNSQDSLLVCDVPSRYTAMEGDCDDSDSTVFPGAPEVCGDSQVNDCLSSVADSWDSCGIVGGYSTFIPDIDLIGDYSMGHILQSVSASGDVNNDDVDDLLIAGELANTRGLFIVLGPIKPDLDVSSALKLPDQTEYNSPVSDHLASTMVVGDINNDSFVDLFTSQLINDAKGMSSVTSLLLGPDFEEPQFTLRLFDSAWVDPRSFSIGDINADNTIDILVSTYTADMGESVFLVFSASSSGEIGTSTAYSTIQVDDDDANKVWDISPNNIGDVNGDGVSDLIFGVPYANYNEVKSGVARLILGPIMDGSVSSTDSDSVFFEDSDGSKLGTQALIADDINGDGRCDVLLTAPNSSHSSIHWGGAAYVLYDFELGANDVANADITVIGTTELQRMGSNFETVSDWSHNGYRDFILTSNNSIRDTGETQQNYTHGYIYLDPSPGRYTDADADSFFSFSPQTSYNLTVLHSATVGGDLNGDTLEDLVFYNSDYQSSTDPYPTLGMASILFGRSF